MSVVGGKVSLPRVFGCFCWLRENTRFRKGERLGKCGKDLNIYSWPIKNLAITLVTHIYLQTVHRSPA